MRRTFSICTFYVPDAPRYLSPVGFELGFTGTAGANAAAQLRHLNAVSGQARHHVLQLRQLHLQLAFPRARMPRKNSRISCVRSITRR